MPPAGKTRAGPRPQPAPWRTFLPAALVFALSWAYFSYQSTAQPIFPDETAYVSQSYFWDLLKRGNRDDWSWVEYHAYDLPPLSKYLAGVAVEAGGYRHAGRSAANAWFLNINAQVVPASVVRAARWPTHILGALGCVAVYAIGAIAAGVPVGFISAALLMLNPLYQVLAARVMSDVPAECLILLTEALGLWIWTRILRGNIHWAAVLAWSCLVGVCAGLAVLAKLNGFLGLLVLLSWSLLAISMQPRNTRQWPKFAVHTTAAAVCASLVFIALNPYMCAKPRGEPPPDLLAPAPPNEGAWPRFLFMLKHRVDVSRTGQSNFPNDALRSLPEKLMAVTVQGFGRFGPLGPPHSSTTPYPRFSWQRDWGGVIWLGLVLTGIAFNATRGWKQVRANQPPLGWALLVWFVVSAATVTLFIPLAWDRYYLPLIPASTVLGASGIVALAALLLPHKPDRTV